MRERTALRWIVPIVALLLCAVIVLSIVTQGFTNWGTPQPQETLYTTNSDGSIMFLDEQTPIIERPELPEVITEAFSIGNGFVTQDDILIFSKMSIEPQDIEISPMSLGSFTSTTSPELLPGYGGMGYCSVTQNFTEYYDDGDYDVAPPTQSVAKINGLPISNYNSSAQIKFPAGTFNVTVPKSFSFSYFGESTQTRTFYLYYAKDDGSWNKAQNGTTDEVHNFAAMGSGTYKICFVVGTNDVPTTWYRSPIYTIAYDLTVFVPIPNAPEKEGYSFAGWYFDSALTQPCTAFEVVENTVLYAKYVINRHTVNFITNGGSTINSTTVDWSTTVNLETYVSTKTGYDFAGWYTNSNLSTKAPNSLTVKNDVTLYAKWEIKILNVTLMVDGVLWKTLQFEYGTGVGAIVSEIESMSLNIENFATDGIIYDGVAESASLFADSIFTLSEKPLTENVKSWDWAKIGIYSGIGLVALGVIVASIVALKKKSYGR